MASTSGMTSVTTGSPWACASSCSRSRHPGMRFSAWVFSAVQRSIQFSISICIVRGDGEVAHHVEDVATADGVARNEGDDRLGHRADVSLELEHVETRNPALADVARLAPDPLIASGAERPLPVLRRPVAGE